MILAAILITLTLVTLLEGSTAMRADYSAQQENWHAPKPAAAWSLKRPD